MEKETEECRNCNGTGSIWSADGKGTRRCGICNGSGMVKISSYNPYLELSKETIKGEDKYIIYRVANNTKIVIEQQDNIENALDVLSRLSSASTTKAFNFVSISRSIFDELNNRGVSIGVVAKDGYK
jgi:RecJ-like exonuclease